ncbi:uncharacterized protein LOC122310008 [Carya illinoinensis]|uniref:uncharacterized protein LOC122310008 n=1 Tax=Carya illinoinensis TaxID=32201 RepID=UPI001C726AB7|nr:uncharacterized protein LOC122310008 [Carya illinoinensis]
MAELAQRTPSTLREFMDRVDDFVYAEDTLQALVDPYKEDTKIEQNNRGERKGKTPSYQTGSRYCKYHQTSSHWTEDYTTMRKRVAELAGTGELERMVAERSKPRRRQETRQGTRQSFSPERRCHVNDRQDKGVRLPPKGDRNRAPIGEIKTIARGFAEGGVSASGRKAYALKARYEEVFVADKAHKQPKLSNEQMVISFEEADREGVLRVLVDNGSSTDILYWEAFVKMGIDVGKLRLSPTPLKGFLRDTIQPIRAITLSVTTGAGTRTATTVTDFLVVKAHSSYNAILARPTLNHLRAVTSTYHLKIKFPTDSGVGEARGEQALA